MGNYSKTYHHIAAILSFKTSSRSLEATLKNPLFNWDALVVEGSKQLVLPALYCRLKARNLLNVIPEELSDYLEEITSINRNRNKAILKEVRFISKLLNDNNIEHVFLKGAALLALGCYKDNAERMVGDIDILIKKPQVYEAFELLKSNGYNKTSGFAYETIDFRHLDRLISENQLAAIEIHAHLLNKKHRSLIDLKSVLTSKTIVNGVAVPKPYYLNLHQIYSWQLNDSGHYYNFPNFKVLYDVIKVNSYKDNDLISDVIHLKYGKSFFAIAKFYFKEFSHIHSGTYMRFISLSHKTLMRCKPLRAITKIGKYAIHFTTKRLSLFLSNKHYTSHILKKIFS